MIVQQISPEATRPIRHLVLWPHIKEEQECVIDIDFQSDALHLGAFMDDKLVGVCSLFSQSSSRLSSVRQVRLRAMATHPDYRKLQVGRKLVEKAIAMATERGYDVLWCDARIGAVGFYSRLNFQSFPDVYDVPRIGPHRFMWIELHSAKQND